MSKIKCPFCHNGTMCTEGYSTCSNCGADNSSIKNDLENFEKIDD